MGGAYDAREGTQVEGTGGQGDMGTRGEADLVEGTRWHVGMLDRGEHTNKDPERQGQRVSWGCMILGHSFGKL